MKYMKFYKTLKGFSKAKEKLIKAGKGYQYIELPNGWLLTELKCTQWTSCHNIDKWQGCYSNGTAHSCRQA